MEKTYLTWTQIELQVERLVELIGETDRFDALLVVTRGGMVPACLISQLTGMRNILVAAVMFYTGVEQTLEKPVFLQFPPDPYLREKRILVVDDVWDSGRTVVSVRERIQEAGGIPTVAVLHFKPNNSRYPGQRPDYYATETDAWIVYPWDPQNPNRGRLPSQLGSDVVESCQ